MIRRETRRTSLPFSRFRLPVALAVALSAIVLTPVRGLASPPPSPGPFACTPSDTVLCLQRGRFAVRVDWRSFFGTGGHGFTRPVTDHTGTFWFFDPNIPELMVKVVDGQQENGHFWVFYGSLTNVAFEVTVIDTATGEIRAYFNPLGIFMGIGDTLAFAVDPGSRPLASPAAGVPATPGTACGGDGTDLCLLDERFRVEVRWTDSQGHRHTAHSVSLSGNSGGFWFDRPADLEMMVRMQDARALNGNFWFFLGPLSQRGFVVQVTDTVTGDIRVYVNPPGTFASLADTSAFPGTP
jgi:hypothetical protein